MNEQLGKGVERLLILIEKRSKMCSSNLETKLASTAGQKGTDALLYNVSRYHIPGWCVALSVMAENSENLSSQVQAWPLRFVMECQQGGRRQFNYH
jgi:hypothetical protein